MPEDFGDALSEACDADDFPPIRNHQSRQFHFNPTLIPFEFSDLRKTE
jgi:hypothetical protein